MGSLTQLQVCHWRTVGGIVPLKKVFLAYIPVVVAKKFCFPSWEFFFTFACSIDVLHCEKGNEAYSEDIKILYYTKNRDTNHELVDAFPIFLHYQELFRVVSKYPRYTNFFFNSVLISYLHTLPPPAQNS